MKRTLRKLATASSLLLALCATTTASAQKSGGVLKISFFDSPASMSLHEEATGAALRPAMGIFNNLVMYRQDQAQNRPDTIVADLATGWSWNEEGTALTFPLRQGVKWHDGRSFTAKDVKCTWDLLLGEASDKLRVNPRKSWYRNLDQVTTKGDYEVTFHLKRPQPAILAPSGLRLVAGIPMSCADARHAYQSDRNRPIQVRRIQAKRSDPHGQEPGLLETGSAVS
jgi:peptide/nickel transport system substrate-binding protein